MMFYFCCLITFCSFRAEHHHLLFHRLLATRVFFRAFPIPELRVAQRPGSPQAAPSACMGL
jgi:hypothetical protein